MKMQSSGFEPIDWISAGPRPSPESVKQFADQILGRPPAEDVKRFAQQILGTAPSNGLQQFVQDITGTQPLPPGAAWQFAQDILGKTNSGASEQEEPVSTHESLMEFLSEISTLHEGA